MAELPGDHRLPALVFLCHMDTVVAGEGWTKDPFGAEESDGHIFGRGACDMKSGLACALSAFSYAAKSFVREGASHRTIRLICTVDEEDFMRGAEAVIRDGWVQKEDWIMDMEQQMDRFRSPTRDVPGLR